MPFVSIMLLISAPYTSAWFPLFFPLSRPLVAPSSMQALNLTTSSFWVLDCKLISIINEMLIKELLWTDYLYTSFMNSCTLHVYGTGTRVVMRHLEASLQPDTTARYLASTDCLNTFRLCPTHATFPCHRPSWEACVFQVHYHLFVFAYCGLWIVHFQASLDQASTVVKRRYIDFAYIKWMFNPTAHKNMYLSINLLPLYCSILPLVRHRPWYLQP